MRRVPARGEGTMPVDPAPPPAPPAIEETQKKTDAPIVDMRDAFARKTPQNAEDLARSRDFIDGKIEMIRRDPNMTPAEKAAAIADLQSRR
jgi:hypothetical protein